MSHRSSREHQQVTSSFCTSGCKKTRILVLDGTSPGPIVSNRSSRLLLRESSPRVISPPPRRTSNTSSVAHGAAARGGTTRAQISSPSLRRRWSAVSRPALERCRSSSCWLAPALVYHPRPPVVPGPDQPKLVACLPAAGRGGVSAQPKSACLHFAPKESRMTRSTRSVAPLLPLD